MNTNTFEVWRGPSRIDGKEIVVLATGFARPSSNKKTGPMIQTHILRADVTPMEALKTGADVSICGGCRHRPTEATGDGYSGRSCYVQVGHGPRGVWESWNAGNVAPIDNLTEFFAGKRVRLGAYGDPAAVPLEVWDEVLAEVEGWTGYTHQWKNPKLQDTLKYCQLSADSCDEAEHAAAAGVGYFRVMEEGGSLLEGETLCPANGEDVTCATCMACDGSDARIVIEAHGIGAGHFTEKRTRTLPVLNPPRRGQEAA